MKQLKKLWLWAQENPWKATAIGVGALAIIGTGTYFGVKTHMAGQQKLTSSDPVDLVGSGAQVVHRTNPCLSAVNQVKRDLVNATNGEASVKVLGPKKGLFRAYDVTMKPGKCFYDSMDKVDKVCKQHKLIYNEASIGFVELVENPYLS